MELFAVVRERTNLSQRAVHTIAFFSHAIFFYEQFESKISKSSEAKVIYYTFWNNAYPLGLAINKRKLGKPIIISRLHGGDLYNEVSYSGRQPFKEIMAKELNALVFVSRFGRDYFSDRWRGYEKKMYYFPLGVVFFGRTELERSSVFRLVSCSNMIDSKRVDLIIRGLAEVNINRTDYKKIEWHHFGDGTEKDKCNKLAESMLSDEIEFIFEGYVKNEDIKKFYVDNAINCFITTTKSEGSPISIQEALAAGIPVIGTNVGGICDLVKENGVLLPANPTTDEVGRAIQFVMELSITKLKEMGDESYRIWREGFNAEKNSKDFTEFLRKLQ